MSQKAATIYASKQDTDRRAILRDLFSNIRLNGNFIEVEHALLVAAIAKKVRQEKEHRNTFEQTVNNNSTEEEFVNGTVSPLWLGIMNLFQTFDDLESVKDKQSDIQAVRQVLDEDVAI